MKHLVTIAVAAGALAVAGTASAQTYVDYESDYTIQRAARGAPNHALEVGANIGYTQGFGLLQRGENLRDISGAGLGVGADLGFRVSPHFAILWSGQYQEFQVAPEQNISNGVRGVASSVNFVGHIMPFERVDPWISLGTGYRMLWNARSLPEHTVLTHGFELGRLQLGLDLRASRMVALGPVVGADVNYMGWRMINGDNFEIADKRVSTYLFAGVQGHFDVGSYERVVRTEAADLY